MRTSAALASMRTLIECVHAVTLSGWGRAKGVRGNLPPLRRPVLCWPNACPVRACAGPCDPCENRRLHPFSPRARSFITTSLAQGRDSSRSNRVRAATAGCLVSTSDGAAPAGPPNTRPTDSSSNLCWALVLVVRSAIPNSSRCSCIPKSSRAPCAPLGGRPFTLWAVRLLSPHESSTCHESSSKCIWSVGLAPPRLPM